MATYESVIKITGAVGDLVFYNLNGKNVVRKKSGFNKTAFKKSPSYEKVRQNSSEFGHCSKIGKIIRKSVENYTREAGDPLLYQKFTKVMTAIKDLDKISERGKRTVANGLKTEEGKMLLREFEFGGISKVEECISIQDQMLCKRGECASEQTLFMTIKLDSEKYITESAEEIIHWNKERKSSFKNYFSNDDVLLYFAVLKNKHNEITHMGFV